MSNKLPIFRLTIVADSPRELRAQILEYLGLDKEVGPNRPEEQEDFLTEAAAQPLPEKTEPSPFTARPIPLPVFIAETPSVSTDTAAVDSKGMPWDARIHAAGRTVTKDGSWRYKRGVEDSQIRVIEQELLIKARGMQEAQMVEIPPVTIPHIPAPAPIAPPPMPPPEPSVPNAHTAQTFQKLLVPTLAKLIKEGKLTPEYVEQLKTHFGVQEIYMVSPAQAEEMFNNFVQYGMIAKAL